MRFPQDQERRQDAGWQIFFSRGSCVLSCVEGLKALGRLATTTTPILDNGEKREEAAEDRHQMKNIFDQPVDEVFQLELCRFSWATYDEI